MEQDYHEHVTNLLASSLYISSDFTQGSNGAQSGPLLHSLSVLGVSWVRVDPLSPKSYTMRLPFTSAATVSASYLTSREASSIRN